MNPRGPAPDAEALVEPALVELRRAMADQPALSTPRLGLILGSGLSGTIASIMDVAGELSFDVIPGLSGDLPAGHPGRVAWGRIDGVPCLVFLGRRHLYDGGGPDPAALPARMAGTLGVEVLVLTNAAGAIRHTLEPGDIMIIDDHINLMWGNPLTGPVRSGEARFPDMSAPYDPALQRLIEEVARENAVRVERGVYAAVLGPSYETPAEVGMLARLGADAVGMSTVPEVLAARAAGVRVVGLSLITNAAAGMSAAQLTHDEVLEAGRGAEHALAVMVRAIAAHLQEKTRPDS